MILLRSVPKRELDDIEAARAFRCIRKAAYSIWKLGRTLEQYERRKAQASGADDAEDDDDSEDEQCGEVAEFPEPERLASDIAGNRVQTATRSAEHEEAAAADEVWRKLYEETLDRQHLGRHSIPPVKVEEEADILVYSLPMISAAGSSFHRPGTPHPAARHSSVPSHNTRFDESRVIGPFESYYTADDLDARNYIAPELPEILDPEHYNLRGHRSADNMRPRRGKSAI